MPLIKGEERDISTKKAVLLLLIPMILKNVNFVRKYSKQKYLFDMFLTQRIVRLFMKEQIHGQ